MQALSFVYSDDAVFTDLFHRVSQQRSDFTVVIGGDSGHIRHLRLFANLLGHRMQLGGDIRHSLFHACLHLNRIDARHDGLEAFIEDRLSHDCGGRGAVTSDVAGLAGHFTDHPGAHVFVNIFQVDFLGDRDTVLGNSGAAEALLQNDIATLGAERHFDRSS